MTSYHRPVALPDAVRERRRRPRVQRSVVGQSRQQLRQRWHERDGRQLAVAVLDRLRLGATLDDLGLAEHEGRTDLRGLAVPTPRSVRHLVAGRSAVEQQAGFFELSHARWERLDLSHAVLDGLQAERLRAADCRFDHASMRHVRLWATEIEACSFDQATFRGAGLGAWSRGGPNRFERCTLREADLRGAACSAAIFEDCDFSRARLDKVDFGATRFDRCRFAGELREVMFNRSYPVNTGRGLEQLDLGNELRDCDFTEAVLLWTDFRQLDLRTVTLPRDSDLIIVRNYACVLDRLLSSLDGERSPVALALRGLLENDRKWLHPDREVGLFHRTALREMNDEATVVEAERALREAEERCVSERGSRLRRLTRRSGR